MQPWKLLITLGVTLAFMTANALAQAAFPSKTVKIVTPFPVGSGPDVLLRAITPKLQQKWGQGVIVENKPGGNGFIAVDAFKRGRQDGHDLLLIDSMNLTGYPHMFKKLPYDVARDFEPIIPVFQAPFFFVVSTQSKFKSVGDIVAAAKANPGRLNYGSWSIGNPVHLGISMLQAMTGTDMQHIVYKDAVVMYAAVTTQEVDFALGTLATVATFTGRLKPIAVATPTRLASRPDVPTVAEAGGPAGFDASGWGLMLVPRGAPATAVQRIRADVDAALAEGDVQELFKGFGYERLQLTPTQLSTRLATDSLKLSNVIRRSNISID